MDWETRDKIAEYSQIIGWAVIAGFVSLFFIMAIIDVIIGNY